MPRALVTGASEGIGRALTHALIAQGYEVLGVARNEGRLKELSDAFGARFTYAVADLSEAAGMDQVAALVREGSWDLLVNNAGFGVIGHFVASPLAAQRTMIRLNCEAVVTLSHAFLETASKGAALINVSSVISFMPMPRYAVYAATKAFVTSFTEGISYQASKRGIYVMALCPGATESEFHKRAGRMERSEHVHVESADDVVRTALNALTRRDKVVVVSGLMNKISAALPRFFPRELVLKLTSRIS